MNFSGKNVIVTGGAGFIGSHVVDELLSRGAKVTVIDNMRTGQPQVVDEHKKNENYSFLKSDILDAENLNQAFRNMDFVFHLAANADIRGGLNNTRIDLEQNTIATYNVLEAMRLNDVKGLAFSSSGAVYGIQKTFPVSEDAPKVQNSLYGASKLSGEAMIEAFSEYYGLSASIYRFVSVVGERYPHGVVIDFYHKLKNNPESLEILGDGKQQKSYMYIKDCVDGIFLGIEGTGKGSEVYNLGQDYTIGVIQVADIVTEEMNLKNVRYDYTGGKGGWIGDQPVVLLSTDKIRSLGWDPKVKIEEGIRRTIRYLISTE
jgi:UDP-glucose 4-epimerase